jgi:S-(hydroxymethyl)glutathione dehydrogenase/alcohol dehydrogenase
MKAAVLHEVGQPLVIEDVEVANPAPREVRLRTVAAGVCHSDLHFVNGDYTWPLPAVLGHESACVVEAVGSDVSYVAPGDHVITCLSVFCGHCRYCTSGRPVLCLRKGLTRKRDQPPRLTMGGERVNQFLNLSSYAEEMLVHEHAVVKIREDMPMDRACLVGCGVTTGVGAVLNTARIEGGSSVAVIGCGGVGLSAVQGARLGGAARIIAIDMNQGKLELARKMGATDGVNASEVDPVEAVKELSDGGVDYSFEAIGLKKTAEQAFQMLGKGGTATIVGMVPEGVHIELHGPDLLDEKRLQGSNMGSNRFRVDMPRYIDFYLQGRLNLDDMLSAEIRLEDVNDAFAALDTGELARQVIRFS